MQQPVVPAWKRLGLKLKYANEKPESVGESRPNGLASTNQGLETTAPAKELPNSDGPPKKKRKVTSGTEKHLLADSEHQVSTDTHATAKNGKAKKVKKRVSFAADAEPQPESSAIPSAQNDDPSKDPISSKPKKAKKKGKSGSKLHHAGLAKTNPALEYLDQFHRAHASWKFNKNKETWLLKHMFSEHDIPGTYNLALAKYIHGLKGSGARDRLKTQCVELLKKDAKDDTKNGSKDGKHYLGDGNFLPLLKRDLEIDPDATEPPSENQKDNEEYLSWIRQQSRPRLLVRSLGLDPEALHTSGDEGLNGAREADATPKKKTNRKSRTTAVEYSSSSSSSSSESDSDSDTDVESDVEEAKTSKAEEATSSSGTDDSSTDSTSDSDSDST
ncbi:hypothetical protein EDD37DRAFT_639050 [Exophiala viscosa]|uniref:uncharacterized protein n=1 Tax=Exophiala viscosa TaxID=2486360 RepID=UPI00219779B4|nr:hypothetical protein EDD37DRAFT_639050 [Exophiala viscosa]